MFKAEVKPAVSMGEEKAQAIAGRMREVFLAAALASDEEDGYDGDPYLTEDD